MVVYFVILPYIIHLPPISMKAVYKVTAETDNIIQRNGWERIITWGPLEYDSQITEGGLFATKEAAERHAERKNNRVIELLASRINSLTGIKMGKGATEYRMCVQALKEKPYRVTSVTLRDR
tara:strand:+ start:393 stop:758 length:366 start_codon:yes stop_codon:yes gene_type:complete